MRRELPGNPYFGRLKALMAERRLLNWLSTKSGFIRQVINLSDDKSSAGIFPASQINKK